MSNRVTAIWTCDRCRTTVETARGKSPIDWAHFQLAPYGLDPHFQSVRMDLCLLCTKDVREMLEALPKPPTFVVGRD